MMSSAFPFPFPAIRVVVGAHHEWSGSRVINAGENDNSAAWSGAAYVFVREGAHWVQQAYLKAANAAANHQFGGAVAIAGETLVVGARYELSNARGINGDGSTNNTSVAGAA